MKVVDRHSGHWTSSVEATASLLVVGRIGTRRFAWPVSSVERVLPMAAVTQVADLPSWIVGLVDLHGETLAVVDPRPRLGLPLQVARPEQHLLLFVAPERYLLWVDSVEKIVSVASGAIEQMEAADGPALAPCVTRIDGQLVAVLSSTLFDPGHVTQSLASLR